MSVRLLGAFLSPPPHGQAPRLACAKTCWRNTPGSKRAVNHSLTTRRQAHLVLARVTRCHGAIRDTVDRSSLGGGRRLVGARWSNGHVGTRGTTQAEFADCFRTDGSRNARHGRADSSRNHLDLLLNAPILSKHPALAHRRSSRASPQVGCYSETGSAERALLSTRMTDADLRNGLGL